MLQGRFFTHLNFIHFVRTCWRFEGLNYIAWVLSNVQLAAHLQRCHVNMCQGLNTASWCLGRSAVKQHLHMCARSVSTCVSHYWGPAPFPLLAWSPLLHFEIWTNTFCNLDKYFLQFGQILLKLLTSKSKDKYIFHMYTGVSHYWGRLCPSVSAKPPFSLLVCLATWI